MTITLPAPVVTTPGSPYADQRGRTRKITYTQPDGAAATIVSVSHNKARKAYVVSIQPITIEARDGYSVQGFTAFSGIVVAEVPAARFSAAKIEEVTATTIRNVETMVAASEKIARLFTDPGAASQEMFPR